MLKAKEPFCNLSKRDMQRMWRTLKAEKGDYTIISNWSGTEGSFREAMVVMENRLYEEVANRPTFLQKIFKRR